MKDTSEGELGLPSLPAHGHVHRTHEPIVSDRSPVATDSQLISDHVPPSSHVLIARNSRSPAFPQTTRLPGPFAPSSRSSTSLLFGADTEDIDFLRDGTNHVGSGLRRSVSAGQSEEEADEDEQDDPDFEVERTFRREKTSDVKVTAGTKEFW